MTMAKPKTKAKAKPAAKKAPAKKPAAAKAKAAASAKSAKPAKPTKAAKPAPAKSSAKQPATRRAGTDPGTGVLRGAELVEKVLAKLGNPDRGLPQDQIARMTLPDGAPLPPSIARLLAADATAFPELRFQTFPDMIRERFGDDVAASFQGFESILSGACLLLPHGTDSCRFMYVGKPDAYGEYPVLIADTDDIPWVGLAYPGLDVFLADGTITTIVKDDYMDAWENPAYEPMLEDQARRNLQGFKAISFQDAEHVDGAEAASAQLSSLFGDVAGDAETQTFDDFS
jgi:hypothetical protein